ncbi:GNAT family N-acetyltransferase [Ekhidna sp.]
MAESIAYYEFEDSDFDSLLHMSQKLWTGFDEDALKELLIKTSKSNNQKIWIARAYGKRAGFSIFSIRTDYVEGAEKTPTGYLEGIFVEQEFRKLGIAKEFVQLGEKWCKERGCRQIGSDTWLTDTKSRDFHKKVGFWEEDELVHFLKDIK